MLRQPFDCQCCSITAFSYSLVVLDVFLLYSHSVICPRKLVHWDSRGESLDRAELFCTVEHSHSARLPLSSTSRQPFATVPWPKFLGLLHTALVLMSTYCRQRRSECAKCINSLYCLVVCIGEAWALWLFKMAFYHSNIQSSGWKASASPSAWTHDTFNRNN